MTPHLNPAPQGGEEVCVVLTPAENPDEPK